MDGQNQVQIYMALDERTDAWRPVRAISAGPKVYTIVPKTPIHQGSVSIRRGSTNNLAGPGAI
jgi:hypothetical protein